MTDSEWLERQQREHNLRSFRRVRGRVYWFTDRQMEIALRSLERQESDE